MFTSQGTQSIAGRLCAVAGFVWGVALGSFVSLVPTGILLSVFVGSPNWLAATLLPQVVAILFITSSLARRVDEVSHPNPIMESIGAFTVEFLTAFFTTLIALPFLLLELTRGIARQIKGISIVEFHPALFDLAGNRQTAAKPTSSQKPPVHADKEG